MSIDIALVDDEQIYLEEIEQICRKFGEDVSIQINTFPFSDGETFLNSIDRNCYSIVFMDIYMNGMNGVCTAQILRERNSRCILIFLTSSKDHMPEAFSCHAFEYTTKPFTEQRFADVLKDALKIMPPLSKYINIHSDRKTVKILLDEIISVITDAHYIDIKTSDGKVLRFRMTMTQFIEQTDNDPRFILINRGIVVNADYIISFENNCCILDNGTRLPISVRKRVNIEQSVQNYNFDKIRSRQRHGK